MQSNLEHKKFPSIKRANKIGRDLIINEGEEYIVEEKIDGANASFQLYRDENGDWQIVAYSRRLKLSAENNLRGWFEFATQKILPRARSMDSQGLALDRYRFYGEWLVSHSVKYRDDAYQKFYLFDVYDQIAERWMSKAYVVTIAALLELSVPLIMGKGQYHDDFYDEVNEKYVGRSALTEDGTGGEVVVLKFKPVEKEIDGEIQQVPRYIKVVTEKFSEQKSAKIYRPLTEAENWVLQFATDARIDKTIMKCVDNRTIPEAIFPNFGAIARTVSQDVFDDIMSEEADSFKNGFDTKAIRKIINGRVPHRVRPFIENGGEI